MTFPHPGYLDAYVPKVALRLGEQRRVDFEYPGLLDESPGYWGPTDARDDFRIEIVNPNVVLCGLCGCFFSLKFETSVVYGELTSGPGRGCNHSRHYAIRIQRPRWPHHPDRWSVRLD